MDKRETATRESEDIVFRWEDEKGHVNEIRFRGYLIENSLFSTGQKNQNLLSDRDEHSEYLNILVGLFLEFLKTPWADMNFPAPMTVPYRNIDSLEGLLYEGSHTHAGFTFMEATIIPVFGTYSDRFEL